MILTKKSNIYIAGHKGLVGSSILRTLVALGYKNIIIKTRKQLDLTNQKNVLNLKLILINQSPMV